MAKDSGEYRLVKEVKVDILKQFVKVGRVFVPRFAAYATLFTGLFAFYCYFLASQGALDTIFSFFGLFFGGVGSAIFWFETVKTWRQRP